MTPDDSNDPSQQLSICIPILCRGSEKSALKNHCRIENHGVVKYRQVVIRIFQHNGLLGRGMYDFCVLFKLRLFLEDVE